MVTVSPSEELGRASAILWVHLRCSPEPRQGLICACPLEEGSGCFRDSRVHASVLGCRGCGEGPLGRPGSGAAAGSRPLPLPCGFCFQLQDVCAPPWKAVCLPSPCRSAGPAGPTLLLSRTKPDGCGGRGARGPGKQAVASGDEEGGLLGGGGTGPEKSFSWCLYNPCFPPASRFQVS